MKQINFFHDEAEQPLFAGLLFAILVAIISKIIALFLPQIGGATIAILLGIVSGNMIGHQKYFAKGTRFAESKLLEVAVVLLGTSVSFQTVAEIGNQGVLFILGMMTSTIFFACFIGKKLHFNKRTALLMAGGNAICGSSAIASIAPVIGAKEAEKGKIITLVNLMGTVMMLTLPFLGKMIFPDSQLAQSALLGGTLQSVGQVVAGANFLNSEVVRYAMLFKIMRILLLVVVVYLFEKWVSDSGKEKQKRQKKFHLPWYIIGFLVLCTINSFLTLPVFLTNSAHFFSQWFEVTALAAIGLRLDLKRFLSEGPRLTLYGLAVGLFQTISAVLLISFFLK